MLNNFYDEMNKTILKTDVLLETVCQCYDIDTYYCESADVIYESSNSFVEKTKSIFKSMIEAVKKFTKNLIETIKKKVSDAAFKIKLKKLKKQLELTDKFEFNDSKKYVFKTREEAIALAEKMCNDMEKIVNVINSKKFKSEEDLDDLANKLTNAWSDKYEKIWDTNDDDNESYININLKSFRDAAKIIDDAENRSIDKILLALDSQMEKILNNTAKKCEASSTDELATAKVKWYKKLSNTMISGCNKVKSAVAKHPFIAISAVAAACSGITGIAATKLISDKKNKEIDELASDRKGFLHVASDLYVKNFKAEKQINNLEDKIEELNTKQQRRNSQQNDNLFRYGSHSF